MIKHLNIISSPHINIISLLYIVNDTSKMINRLGDSSSSS